MMRLAPSEIELTQVDVTTALREVAVRRRAVQAARKAIGLALQDISGNSRNTALDLDCPKSSTSPPPLRFAEPGRDESIIAKGPAPRGKKEFWDNVVVEARTIYDTVPNGEDWPLRSPGHVHGDTVMTEDSFDGLFNITGESEPLRVDYNMIDKNECTDRETIHGDIGLTQDNGREPYARRRQGDGLDGAGEGSSFSSQSISNSSLPWRQEDSEDDEGFPSQFQEEVVLGLHGTPDHSQFGQREGSKSNNTATKREARVSTLSHCFSALLNLNDSPEDSSFSSLQSPPPLRSSHSEDILPDLNRPEHQISTGESESPSLEQTHCWSSTSTDTKMGLKMWSDKDYEKSVTLPTDVQTGNQTDQTCPSAGVGGDGSSSGGSSTMRTEANSSTSGITIIDLRHPSNSSDPFQPTSNVHILFEGPVDWTGLSPASPPPEAHSPPSQYSEFLGLPVRRAWEGSGALNGAARLPNTLGASSNAGSSVG